MPGCNNNSRLSAEEVQELKQICRYVRKMIINTVADAGCGHTGGSLSEVEILVGLYFRIMNIDPHNPDWQERDRFILSKGHASPGYYSVLANRDYFYEGKLADGFLSNLGYSLILSTNLHLLILLFLRIHSIIMS